MVSADDAQATEEPQDPEAAGSRQGYQPDPFPRDGIDLGDGRRLQFYRSNRFQQAAIVFKGSEGVDPKPQKEHGDTEWLRQHQWTWRGEEGAWTQQFLNDQDKQAVEAAKSEKGEEEAALLRRQLIAQGDARAHPQFVELANRIRERNGLEPVSAPPSPQQSR